MNTEKKKKSLLWPIAIGIVVIAAASYGVKKYIDSKHFVSTDDAQIDADIVPVIARIGGFVNEVHIEDHQQVAKGDVLIKIDDSEFKVKAAEAEAALNNTLTNVNVSKSNLTSTRANIATAKANIESAKVKLWQANQDFERYKNLFADKVVTTQQYENAKTAKEEAETGLVNAQAFYNVVLKQINASESQVDAALSTIALRQAELDYAKLQLSYTTIKAPVSGVVSKKTIQIGQFINPGQNLFVLVNDSSIYVTANFKETQLEKIKKGNKVEIEVDAFPDLKVEGEVYSLSPATGARFALLPPDNATGNYVKVVQRIPVKIKITSGYEVIKKLKPGINVYVTVRID